MRNFRRFCEAAHTAVLYAKPLSQRDTFKHLPLAEHLALVVTPLHLSHLGDGNHDNSGKQLHAAF